MAPRPSFQDLWIGGPNPGVEKPGLSNVLTGQGVQGQFLVTLDSTSARGMRVRFGVIRTAGPERPRGAIRQIWRSFGAVWVWFNGGLEASYLSLIGNQKRSAARSVTP